VIICLKYIFFGKKGDKKMKQTYIDCPKCGYRTTIPRNAYALSKDMTIIKSYEIQCPKCGKYIRIMLYPSDEEMFNKIFNEVGKTK
jgi:DNA-directed RNA polymerase subunit RPC12/RpoP